MMKLSKYIGIAIYVFLNILPFISHAQKINWQNLDLAADSTFGISTEKAYNEFLIGKHSHTVIVAVIDGGVDTAQEDLKSKIWNNPKKNKIADAHGWNYIGGSNGNVQFDNLELVRQIRQQRSVFAKDSSTDSTSFETYSRDLQQLARRVKEAQNNLSGFTRFEKVLEIMLKSMGNGKPTKADFQNYVAETDMEGQVKSTVLFYLEKGMSFQDFKEQQVDRNLEHYQSELNYHLNINFDPRSTIGDNYNNKKENNYGNSNVTGPNAMHGTHVAGIIAATRNNNIGINGVADNVRIMVLRVVPDGDERDKDVANAILYATKNGAKIINMSFGKSISPDKKIIDNAVKYALSKDVLFVQAAGNDNHDIDTVPNFPNRLYAEGKGEASAWIVVGSSSWLDNTALKSPFSNYGKKAVDVFAPGEQIRSTIPGNKYAAFDGTSMACPVVSGLAALIREYYPKLTAVQVKEIILKSVTKVNHPVNIISGGKTTSVPFNELCLTGGIVNAYNALQLAASY